MEKTKLTRFIFSINYDLLKIIKMRALLSNMSASKWLHRAIMDAINKEDSK